MAAPLLVTPGCSSWARCSGSSHGWAASCTGARLVWGSARSARSAPGWMPSPWGTTDAVLSPGALGKELHLRLGSVGGRLEMLHLEGGTRWQRRGQKEPSKCWRGVMEEEEGLLCASREAGGAVSGGWTKVCLLLMGPVGGQRQQSRVQEGSCLAVGLRGVTASPLGTVALCSRTQGLCAERAAGTQCPTGQEKPVPGWGPRRGGSPCSHTPACSCSPPWHCRPGPPCLCPAARHRLISPGARSRCADALVPAPNSQPLALGIAFLEQLREGEQPGLPNARGECHPGPGAWLWVHRRRANNHPKSWPWGRGASGATQAPGNRAGQPPVYLCPCPGAEWPLQPCSGSTASCRVLERGAGVEVMGCGGASGRITWPPCKALGLSVLFL